MSHGDKVSKLPKGFKKIGSSNNSPIAAFDNTLKKIGLQFQKIIPKQKILKYLLETFVDAKENGSKNIVNSHSKGIKEYREG